MKDSMKNFLICSLLGLSLAGRECSAQVAHDWKVTLSLQDTSQQGTSPVEAPDLAGKVGIHLYRLDSVAKEHLVYVPRACEEEGTRCPLLVYLPWGGETARAVMTWLRAPAEKYGLIVLATGYDDYSEPPMAKQDFVIALRQTLRNFPVDRGRIAIAGNCRSGFSSLALGAHNLDIFSRIASISGGPDVTALADLPPQSQVSRPIEFFIDDEMPVTGFKPAAAVEKKGYRVKHRTGWRTHSPNEMYFDALGQWLQESWMIPNPADRLAPVVVAAQLPALTSTALARMTDFWTRFLHEPAPISETARKIYRREVIVPVGEQHVLMTMTDIPTLAKKYPSVATALKAAGLTPQEHEAYRVAIATALLDKRMLETTANLKQLHEHPSPSDNVPLIERAFDAIPNFTIDASSVQGANVTFLNTHPDERGVLFRTGMMATP